MRIEINNQGEQKTYTWTGSCSLTLQYHNGNAWEACPTPWSGCPLCGHAREIPHPIFLGPKATEEIEWDLIVTWCDKGTIKTGPASGRFRFGFRYAEDEPGCRYSLDPLKCWQRYQDKKWQNAYSNEFTVSE